MRVLTVESPSMPQCLSYLVVDEQSNVAFAIDFTDHDQLSDAAQTAGVQVGALLFTNEERACNADAALTAFDAPVHAGSTLTTGQVIELAALRCTVVEAPVDSRDQSSVLFVIGDTSKPSEAASVFTGAFNTLGGCARSILERASSAHLYAVCRIFSTLLDDTLVWPGELCAEANLMFALLVEPDNATAKQMMLMLTATVGKPLLLVPSTVRTEKSVNPFLRVEHLRELLATDASVKECEILDQLRHMFCRTHAAEKTRALPSSTLRVATRIAS